MVGIAPKYNPYQGNSFDYVGFTIGTETTDVITVAVQLQTAKRHDVIQRSHMPWYLSDDANGDSIVATGVTGVTGGTDGIVNQTVTGKSGWAVSESDGDVDFAIQYTGGAKTVYLVIVRPDAQLSVSSAITFA